MNYKKLQEMQKALDDSIIKEKELNLSAEYRFELTCHAFLVELSEVANASEYFKFWKTHKGKIDDKRFIEKIITGEFWDKQKDDLISKAEAQHRTLVEEISDSLHFLLSLANQTGTELGGLDNCFEEINPSRHYFETTEMVMDLLDDFHQLNSMRGLGWNITLIEMHFRAYYTKLGVTQEELEQAYYDKNKVNYERLRSDY